MKKSSFIGGAFIVTFGIIASKILGLLYVVPFHKIIGEQGGALYSYAYTLYDLFTSVSMVGVPLAVSKLVSEYNALGYYNAKERAYKIAMKIIVVMSTIAFLVLFLFAPFLAKQIMGDVTGGNTIEDITFVLRIASLSLLVVSALSVMRGYLQGHKFMAPTSVSQVIEQFVRVGVLLAGSYSAIYIFHLAIRDAVGISVFAACLGAIAALFYLRWKMKGAKELKPKSYEMSKEEKELKDKDILKRILYYALPFVCISIITSCYDLVDTMTVVKTLVNVAGFPAQDAESVMSAMTTWGGKLAVIVTSISSGVTVSLIPNISSSFVKKDMKDVEFKINQAIQMVLYTTIPMATGLSILSIPVWNVFYGSSAYGANVFAFTIFLTIFTSINMNSNIIMQSLNEYKTVFLSLFVGLIWNAIMNVPLMTFCYRIGLPAYYGATIASMTGYVLSIGICLIHIKRKFHIEYKETIKYFFHILFADVMMILAILLLNHIFPIEVSGTFQSILVIALYTVVGAFVYIGISFFDNTLYGVFGKDYVRNILSRIPVLKKLVK